MPHDEIHARETQHQARPLPRADFFVHPGKDPGVYHDAQDYLRFALNTYRHALVFMDRMGSGQETKSRNELEDELEGALFRS